MCTHFIHIHTTQAGLSVGFGSLSEMVEGGVFEYKRVLVAGNGTSNSSEWACVITNGRSESYSDVSKFVTIINVLLGSSVIGGALGYFVDSMLASRGKWFQAELEDEVLEKKKEEASIHTRRRGYMYEYM